MLGYLTAWKPSEAAPTHEPSGGLDWGDEVDDRGHSPMSSYIV